MRISREIRKLELAVAHRHLELLSHMKSVRHLPASLAGARPENPATFLGFPDCSLGAWTSGVGLVFHMQESSLNPG